MNNSVARSLDAAWNLLAKFRHNLRAPAPTDKDFFTVQIDEPLTCMVVGELSAVAYRVKGQRKAFFHRFDQKHRPLLCVSSDGKQIVIVKGRFRFSDRGFIK